MRALLALFACLGAAVAATAQPKSDIPIFDAHLHYSHDAVQMLPPADAIRILRQAGLRKALVSSSDDDGTQKLHALAPDLIVPSLRPYRRRSDISTWVRDDGIITYMEERLAKYRYAALGEFHVYGADADLPVVRRVVELARQHRLVLHLHGDAEAVHRVMRQFPEAIILWAHSGFAAIPEIEAVLKAYPKLYADLAFRTDHIGAGDTVQDEWAALFRRHPDRFMLGTDTFTPERWYFIEPHARSARAWLARLPDDLSEKIAWRNAEKLFARP